MLQRVCPRVADHPATPWVLVVIGFCLRLRRYLQVRGVMHDEALLAFNVLTKNARQLLHPLALGNQVSPVGFVLAQKAVTTLLGGGEWVLRLIPFLAAIAALPLFFALARKILPRPAALLALAWFALAEPLVRYAAEGKQYSTDVLCTIVVMLLAVSAGGVADVLILAVAGAVLIWFSHPIVFVLGGIGLGLGFAHLRRKDRRALAADAAMIVLWLASFAANYFLITRHYAQNHYLNQWWSEQNAFAPVLIRSASQLLWYPKALAGAFEYPVGLAPALNPKAAWIAWVAAGGFLVGCGLLVFRAGRALATVAGALLLCLLASALHKYPFSDRLLLFAMPLLVIPLALAVGSIPRLAPRIALVAILFVYPVYLQAKYALHPPVWYDLKPALRYVQAHWHSGDALYLHWGSDALGHYYLSTQPRCAIADAQPITGVFEPEAGYRQAHYAQDLLSLAGRPRAWIVFSMDPHHERAIFEQILENRGRRLDVYVYPGGAAELYDLR